MITSEVNKKGAIKEIRRVAKKLGNKPLQQEDYRKHYKTPYSIDNIYKRLGLRWNILKELAKLPICKHGIPKGSPPTRGILKKKKPKVKHVLCPARNNMKLLSSHCIPGFRDECASCPNPVEGNIKAADHVSNREWQETIGHGSAYMNGQREYMEISYNI